ncbi:hypothetical protein ACFWIB_19210 [Streptomyces sp. NPDC127051]|uniref:hypothetical protein n=1 Tax=Streptomyces sp. NPDC127051 TaxID=3347119 RepID=UPI003651A9CA
MRIRRLLGLALATATLAGASALGAATAQAAAPTITSAECTDQGGTVASQPYGGTWCVLPDGTKVAVS